MSSAKNFRLGPSIAAWSIRCRWSPTRSNFQLDWLVMPIGRLDVCAGVAVVPAGGGAGACARAAAAQRHAAQDRRKPRVALRNTSDREESRQDITGHETLANRAGEENRSGDADRPARGQRGVKGCRDVRTF